jgi:hypothetical protein
MLTRLDRIIPAQVRADARALRAARHLSLLAAISACSAPLLLLLYHLLGYDAAGLAALAGGAAMALAPLLLRAGAPLALARDLFVGALFLLKIWLALHLGGLSASTAPWFALCPMVAALLGGLRPALAWAGLALAVLAGLYLAGPFTAHPVANRQLLDLAAHAGLVALSTVIMLCALTPARPAQPE